METIDDLEVVDLRGTREEDEAEEDEDEQEEDDSEEDLAGDDEQEIDDSMYVFPSRRTVYPVSCNPADKTLVATGDFDHNVFLWRIGNEAALQLTGHSDSISALAFSSDGHLLASGGADGVVNVWDLSGALRHRFEGPEKEIMWLDWHPRGLIILAASEDFSAWMWNATNGVCLTVFRGHGGPVSIARFTPDGKLVCTASEDCSLRVWNPTSGHCIRVFQGHHTQGICSFTISSDSALAITASADGSICLVNIQSGKVFSTWNGHEGPIVAIALSPSLPFLATADIKHGKLIIWDLHTLSPRFVCDHPKGITRLIWSTSELIFTSCFDRKLRIWDARTGQCVRTLHGHKKSITDIAMTSDSQFVVSASDDKTSRVFPL